MTDADHRSQDILVAGLSGIAPDVPVISEEASVPPPAVRQQWQRVWLVDPLDGTRGFVAGNDHFVINIALVAGGAPVLGIIHQPTSGTSFAAWRETAGAWRGLCRDGAGVATDLGLRSAGRGGDTLRVVVSSHYGDSDIEYLPRVLRREYAGVEVRKIASALKFCRMAAGEADFYVRHAPTCEWDTAAGQALLEAVGGGICDFSGRPLTYNRRDSLINPGFYAYGRTLADKRWL